MSRHETRPRKTKARATETGTGSSSDRVTNLALTRATPTGRIALIEKDISAITAKRLFSSLFRPGRHRRAVGSPSEMALLLGGA